MKEVDCNIIRDLLPLYEDNVASQETQELVRQHLADCPACREELRKLRAPISIPPDEDEEAVKRFLEYRAEVRRKQNGKLACFVIGFTALIMFLLCYTLIPRSWDFMSRNAEADRIMGGCIVSPADSHYPETWNIDDSYETDSAVVGAFMDVLRGGSYRAELRNVMNYTPFYPLFQNTLIYGSRGTIDLYFVKGNKRTAIVTLHDTNTRQINVRVRFGSNPIWYSYRADGELYDAVFALMQEYGDKTKK